MPYSSDGTRWIYVAYLILLVWVPIPLGSNRAWSWALLEVWVMLIALAWLTGFLRGRYHRGPIFRNAWPVLLVGAAWVGYVWLQLLPWPIEILRWLSPEAARWHVAAALPDAIAAAPLTLDRHGTLDGALKSTAYSIFFALSLILLNSRERIRYATYALIATGTLEALYGTIRDIFPSGERTT